MFKVVIIDDEPWTRGVIKNLANWDKFEMEVVGEAADGETGLALIQKIAPDIVITDVRMPRLNGIDLVGILRKEGMHMPVLIISGYDDYSYVRSAMQLGVTDYILKPIKPEELNTQLQKCRSLLQARPVEANPIRAGFLADGWESEYQKLHKQIVTTLQTLDTAALEINMKKLYKAVVRHEGENPDQALQIGLYYAFIYPMQKHMEKLGMQKECVFTSQQTTFVFSRENTLQQVFSFVNELYTAVIKKNASIHNNMRLDIQAVCRYMEENYLSGITLEQTADVFHVSKEHLSKAFKNDQSIGFSEKVISLRMNKAKEYVMQKNIPMKEIGFLVNYYDQAHFYKTFKKFFGKTPGEMRKELNSDNVIAP